MAVEELVATGEDTSLYEGWQNWCGHKPQAPAGEVYSEMMLSVPVAGQRLVAKFDRVLVANGQAWIFDWKTGRKKPEQAQHAQ